MPGAGGYGPPAERDRAAIARDLAEDVIDAETARRIYGYDGSCTGEGRASEIAGGG